MAIKVKKMTKSAIRAAEFAAREAQRAAYLAPIREAIAEGRAYLSTFRGEFKVQSYDDTTGWAVVGNGTGMFDTHHFMICADRIQIRPHA
jgi:uncharacterized protein YnzC (UPF0291/DUF896 family)